MIVGNPPKQEIYIHERPQCDFWRTSKNPCSLVKPFGKPTDPILPFLFRQEFLSPKMGNLIVRLPASSFNLLLLEIWRRSFGGNICCCPLSPCQGKNEPFFKKEEGKMWRGKWSRPTRHFFLKKCDLLASLGNFFISNPEPPSCHHYTRNRRRRRLGRTSQSKQSTTFCGFPNNFFSARGNILWETVGGRNSCLPSTVI